MIKLINGGLKILKGIYDWEEIHATRHKDTVTIMACREQVTTEDMIVGVDFTLDQAREVVASLQELIDMEVRDESDK